MPSFGDDFELEEARPDDGIHLPVKTSTGIKYNTGVIIWSFGLM